MYQTHPRNLVFTFILLLALSILAASYSFAGISQQEQPEETSQTPKMRSISAPPTQQIKIVKGYLKNHLVHGEITIINQQQKTIEGYIYINNSQKQYIHGEIYDEHTISAYDQKGNHYILSFE